MICAFNATEGTDECAPLPSKEVVFSDRAKKILEIAWEKAQKHKNTKIASENLLWAITQTPDSVAMQVLSNLGVDVLEINQGILKELEELKKNDE